MNSIDEVVRRLTEIVDEAKRRESRAGYFAALYRKVTRRVGEKVEEGNYFDDNARMVELDIRFAGRYLAAYDQWQAGTRPTESWAYAFAATGQWWPIVLQHLLLGMNAHINLDLGIAAAETVGRDGLPGLHDDFNRINELLAGLVGEVREELTWVWPPLRWLNRRLGKVESALINFSMEAARDAAWGFAEDLAALDDDARSERIQAHDREVVAIGRRVRHPGVLLSGITRIVRLGERGTVARIITELE